MSCLQQPIITAAASLQVARLTHVEVAEMVGWVLDQK